MNNKVQGLTLFWFRRDLRLEDNAGLYHALKNHENVQALFIFDTDILDLLQDKKDRRLVFIREALENIQKQLAGLGSSLLVRTGKPRDVWKSLLHEYSIANVYANTDYEPYARERDREIADMLRSRGISFHAFKDQVIFEQDEVLKSDGTPYVVFTPYKNAWQQKLNGFYRQSYPTEQYFRHFHKSELFPVPTLEQLGFESFSPSLPHSDLDEGLVREYAQKRDFPAVPGTSRLGIHLRFGTVSIRKLVSSALELSEVWLSELIWREFYMMILYKFPHVVGNSFHREYDRIQWRNNEGEFALWCAGKTGYPMVDAGMRELNGTGFMHNRLRMVTASFLTKHLLIDWRWGEAYFASRLNDYELASNNGGWQWAAGTGCDAAPYFRIFNPYEQAKKFDPQGEYVRKWVPELLTKDYPPPVVDHKFARECCLEAYKKAVKS